MISERNPSDYMLTFFWARLWVNFEFGQGYVSENLLLTHQFKLKLLAKLCVSPGELMNQPTVSLAVSHNEGRVLKKSKSLIQRG